MAMIAADFSHAQRSGWTLPVAVYGVYAAVCIVALHPAAFAMAQTWLTSSSYHHGVAVAPLAAMMIASRPRIAPATGPLSLAAVAGAALLWLAGHAAGVALVEQIAFVSLLIAGAGVVFGSAALRLWALPLLFLYFMVPFGEVLIPFLQQATALAVVNLLNIFGVTAALDGIFIETTAGRFEIAQACAGLNFLLAALMIAFAYASQTLPSQRSRLVFVLIAAAVALAANFLRVFLLITIATLSDMRFAVGPDHLAIGFVFYGGIFLLLFWIGGKMKGARRVGPEHAPVTASRNWRPAVALAALVPVLAVSLYATSIVNAKPAAALAATISPFSASGWRILPAPENWTPKLTADRVSAATYEKSGERVYVVNGVYTHDRRGGEIVSALNRAADGADWRVATGQSEVLYLFGEAAETTLEILAGPERRRLLVATIYWRGDRVYTDKLGFKWDQMRDKLRGRNPPGGIIMFASDYAGDPSAALARIRAFTSDVETFSSWRARIHGGA